MAPIEREILARSAVSGRDGQEGAPLRQLIESVKDVDALIDLAIREGLVCMLFRHLQRSGALGALGHRHKQRLQSLYYQTLAQNLHLIHDLKQILHGLNDKGIDVVLLQGIILLKHVYDDVGLRPMTDIDLWVQKKDYAPFIGLLNGMGFERDPLYPHTLRKGATTLDLHTHILGADRIRTRRLLLAKGQDSIYRQTRVIDFEGERARSLDRYDQVLYLGLHALKHNVERLLWLADIQNLVVHWNQSHWQALMDRAREWGQERSILYVTFLLAHLLGFHPPREVDQLLGKKKLHTLEERVLRQRIEKGALPAWSHLLFFSPEHGLHRTVPYLLETLFPRPEIMRQVFEHSPRLHVWQLYCMRVFQLLGKIRTSARG
ncbi:MAG: nucleotidyltransferase family protein [Thermodesulfobacteriota bacterium]|nr:nucleotidyltransferase family protein [Thermodesulfobacteriota bacterium]